MTNYTKSTNFATKDTLTSGDPLKIVRGTEINTEFDNIATAVNSKSDTASPTFTGTVTIPTLALSGLTASSAVATNASNALVSVTNTGTGNNVLATSPTLVTPILGTPTSGTLTNATGLPLTTGVTGVLPEANGGTGSSAGNQMFKNRIINGAMVIDQRGTATTPVTVNTAFYTYTVDRWFGYGQGSDGVFTGQRSTTAPTGFTNSVLFTVTTADSSIGASQVYAFGQKIEGFNVADLGWGTASAQTVTLSFQVRASVTGTYSVTFFNSAFNRGYTATFTVNVANTFETKTITISGDTSGTWLTDNGVGLTLWFSLGAGSTYTGTAGAWNAGTTYAATGQVNLIATNGATFYITGVQLEKGSTATSFDYRPYGTELALCQRYYWSSNANTNTTDPALGAGVSATTTAAFIYVAYPVSMRAAPTLTTSGTFNYRSATSLAVSAVGLSTAGNDSCNLNVTTAVNTAGYAGILRNGSTPTAAVLAFSSEL